MLTSVTQWEVSFRRLPADRRKKLAAQRLPWEVAPLEIDSARPCRSFVGALGEFNESNLDTFPKGYSMMEILWEMSSGQARITGLGWIILRRSPSGIRFPAGAYRKRAFPRNRTSASWGRPLTSERAASG